MVSQELILSMNEFFSLLNATGMTLSLALCSLLVGLFLGILFAIFESSKYRGLRYLIHGWGILLRGLPEILIVFFIYFGSSELFILLTDGFTINFYLFELPIKCHSNFLEISPFLCAVIALALLYSAYAAQIFRGAFKAISFGQRESGQALGLSSFFIFIRLIMPQMWRHALPGLGNQWLILLKDTALVSLISVNDVMLQAKNIAVRTQEPFTWYCIAALIYLVITLISQYLIKCLEIYTTRFERN